MSETDDVLIQAAQRKYLHAKLLIRVENQL